MNRLNTEVLNPLLQDLVKTPFYRYFKVGSSFFSDHESISRIWRCVVIGLNAFNRLNCGVIARFGLMMACAG